MPPAPIRELRELTRRRKNLIQERTREANRLHKVLEDAGVKLSSVASDILGASGRAMLDALVLGTTNPEVLAELARGKLRQKLPALRQALTGRFRRHHAFLVSQLLAHLDYLDEAIENVSQQIAEVIAPFDAEVKRLDTILGVGQRTAEVMVAELGIDVDGRAMFGSRAVRLTGGALRSGRSHLDLTVPRPHLEAGLGKRRGPIDNCARGDIEARSVPRAYHAVTVERAVGEWASQVRAAIDERADLISLPDQHEWSVPVASSCQPTFREISVSQNWCEVLRKLPAGAVVDPDLFLIHELAAEVSRRRRDEKAGRREGATSGAIPRRPTDERRTKQEGGPDVQSGVRQAHSTGSRVRVLPVRGPRHCGAHGADQAQPQSGVRCARSARVLRLIG